jgi:hypothetical protein
MSRFTPWLLVLFLLIAACGDADPGAGDVSSPSPDPVAASSTDDASPVAPDFELALAGGGSFRLSAEAKPVYLVFWAEW